MGHNHAKIEIFYCIFANCMVKVIKNRVFRLLATLAVLVSSTIVPLLAQNLPLMPEDAAVRHAVLPDGLNCYVAENPYVKGFADYALVCRESGETLVSLRDVPVASESVVDSTLIFLMNQVESLAAPGGLAIIACGDLKADDMMTKLRYMSYMIPASDPVSMAALSSQGQSEVMFEVLVDHEKNLATVVAHWRAPRTPMSLMNTVQTAIYEKTVHEMGALVCARVRKTLRDRDIPVADVAFRHVGSFELVPDESFSFEVTVRNASVADAEDALKIALASVDAYGASANELIMAEEVYFSQLENIRLGYDRTNAAYVQMCTKAYLMNAPLSASSQSLAFFRSKAISPQSREQIFYGISSALITLPEDSSEAAPKLYFNASDTLSFPSAGQVVKLRSSKKEPLSGGVVWTFSNGFKVMYKQLPTAGKLYYTLAMNGGYADVAGLAKGEGAFMSDYLDLCNISGMKARDFKRALLLSGITMKQQVNLSNIMISGEVRDGNVQLLMKALLAVANERSQDADAVAYHLESEELRLLYAQEDMRSVIDSLMCPDYRYSPYKSAGNISDGFAAKAENLFGKTFSKMNDGVLVLVGDMDESDLRKAIMPYVGEFHTKEALSRRTMVQYQPVSGSMTYNVKGQDDMMSVVVSTRLPMTVENYMASEMAAMMLEHVVSDALKPYGVEVDLRHSRKIYPEERISVMVMIRGEMSPEMLSTLRRAVATASECKVDAAYLAACKAYMKHKYAVQMQEPEYWLHAMTMRYLDGKDYTTGYAARIDAVSDNDIKRILGLLETGSKIEYIINRK